MSLYIGDAGHYIRQQQRFNNPVQHYQSQSNIRVNNIITQIQHVQPPLQQPTSQHNPTVTIHSLQQQSIQKPYHHA